MGNQVLEGTEKFKCALRIRVGKQEHPCRKVVLFFVMKITSATNLTVVRTTEP